MPSLLFQCTGMCKKAIVLDRLLYSFIHSLNRWCSDYVATKDEHFVRDVWPAIVAAMTYLRQFEGVGELKDMVLNEGFPDQTYDTWEVHGCSAYCGGIWIAALRYVSMVECQIETDKRRDDSFVVWLEQCGSQDGRDCW